MLAVSDTLVILGIQTRFFFFFFTQQRKKEREGSDLQALLGQLMISLAYQLLRMSAVNNVHVIPAARTTTPNTTGPIIWERHIVRHELHADYVST